MHRQRAVVLMEELRQHAAVLMEEQSNSSHMSKRRCINRLVCHGFGVLTSMCCGHHHDAEQRATCIDGLPAQSSLRLGPFLFAVAPGYPTEISQEWRAHHHVEGAQRGVANGQVAIDAADTSRHGTMSSGLHRIPAAARSTQEQPKTKHCTGQGLTSITKEATLAALMKGWGLGGRQRFICHMYCPSLMLFIYQI